MIDTRWNENLKNIEIPDNLYLLHVKQTFIEILFSESYVVRNRSRILTLLNIPDPLRSDQHGSVHANGSRRPSSVSSPLLGNGSMASTASASIYNERRMAVTDF